LNNVRIKTPKKSRYGVSSPNDQNEEVEDDAMSDVSAATTVNSIIQSPQISRIIPTNNNQSSSSSLQDE
jgi:hypothetical protein